jgi:hypothetical protein
MPQLGCHCLRFRLHPGAEDPGAGGWGSQPWIQPGVTGPVATFNSGFKSNAASGGFYLNGATSRTVTDGAVSLMYYQNGTATVVAWGRTCG